MYLMPTASSPDHPKVVLKKPIIACSAFSLSAVGMLLKRQLRLCESKLRYCAILREQNPGLLG